MTEFINNDCINEMNSMPWEFFDFAFADPPFNIGQNYQGHDDRMDPQKYRTFTRLWFKQLVQVVRGPVAVHIPDDLVFDFLSMAQDFLLRRIAWINLYYGFGQNTWNNWVDSRCHCLVFVPQSCAVHTWNPESIAIASARVRYRDRRIHDTERGGKRVPPTIWGVPSVDGPNWGRIQGNNRERWTKQKGALVDHPNQLPEKYLARLILAYTNMGDRILDPFCGSGTTAVVAKKLKRQCTTIEIDQLTLDSAKKRVERGAVSI